MAWSGDKLVSHLSLKAWLAPAELEPVTHTVFQQGGKVNKAHEADDALSCLVERIALWWAWQMKSSAWLIICWKKSIFLDFPETVAKGETDRPDSRLLTDPIHAFTYLPTVQWTDWLIKSGWLTGWPTYWLTEYLTDWLDGLTHWTDWLSEWLDKDWSKGQHRHIQTPSNRNR